MRFSPLRLTGRATASTRLGIAATFALLVAGCAVAPRPAPPAVWHTTTLGLCEDYPEETRTLVKARQDLAAARAAGASVLRIAFGWDAMEPERGRYDWSFWDEFVRSATNDHGIRLIPYICYTPKWAASDQGENYWRSPPRDPADFARFVAAIVTRYRTQIRSWELWNEPDNQAYWTGTPQEFAALVRAGSAAVRQADPTATIVLGGIAGELDFLAAVLRSEGIPRAVDVVNIHSYFETWHPNRIEQLPNYLESAAGLIRDTGGRQPLWMAETGYSSVGGRAEVSGVYRARFPGEHTDDAQAAALVRTVLTGIATTKLDLLAWYRINDLPSGQDVIGDDNNRHLGLRRTNGTLKPAFAAFRQLSQYFAQPYAVVTPHVTVQQLRDGEPEVRGFRLRDDRWVVAAWIAQPATPPVRTATADTRLATLTIQVPDLRARRVVVRDALGVSYPESMGTWRRTQSGTELRWTLQAGEIRIAELRP